VFMPVGTHGTVKGLTPEVLHNIGVGIILANAYHLYLRPGTDTVAALGGLHRFTGWSGPILTDSGGFQVFSLGGLQRIDESGVTFKSHLDGSMHHYSPERAMAVQAELGADIIMPLDECLAYPASREAVAASVELTSRWAVRCVEAQQRPREQSLFGIVQGGAYADLRHKSATDLVALDLPGYAIGGLSVGEPADVLLPVLDATVQHLPSDRPRYLMGVGTPDLLVEGVRRGVDMFDCVLPTRTARLGTALVPEGRLVLRNAPFARDERPIQEGCDCYTCQGFSRGYIRHLLKAQEMLGGQLITMHNLRYLTRLMADMRAAILADRFEQFASEFWHQRNGTHGPRV
jgi:queuine tRNA-ribosyltransferase